jgi:hypothetical protein
MRNSRLKTTTEDYAGERCERCIGAKVRGDYDIGRLRRNLITRYEVTTGGFDIVSVSSLSAMLLCNL